MNARNTRLLHRIAAPEHILCLPFVVAFVLSLVTAFAPVLEVQPVQVSWSIDSHASEGNVVDMTY